MFLKVRCVAHLTFFKRYALMPDVKNILSSLPPAPVLPECPRLPPIIGLASRPVFRAARGFLGSLKFVSLEFPFPDPRRQTLDPKL